MLDLKTSQYKSLYVESNPKQILFNAGCTDIIFSPDAFIYLVCSLRVASAVLTSALPMLSNIGRFLDWTHLFMFSASGSGGQSKQTGKKRYESVLINRNAYKIIK